MDNSRKEEQNFAREEQTNCQGKGINRKNLTDEGKSHFRHTLYPNNDELTGLVGFINIQGLPIERSSKNFDLTNLLGDYRFDHLGLSELNLNLRVLPNEDQIPVRFRENFPAGKLAITEANNIQDKISGNHQYGGTA
eukprot:8995801-Ditylum_brightwellii.AAC.1